MQIISIFVVLVFCFVSTLLCSKVVLLILNSCFLYVSFVKSQRGDVVIDPFFSVLLFVLIWKVAECMQQYNYCKTLFSRTYSKNKTE